MRKIMFAILTVLAAGTASLAGTEPAAARDYPYCLQGRLAGYPGDCSFPSFATCMAAASGQDAYCGVNPRFAFRAQPQPPRKPRYYAY
jgi:hypothetical protein